MGGDPHIKNKPFYLAVRVNLLICARSPIFYLWEYHFRFVLSLSAEAYTKYVLLE